MPTLSRSLPTPWLLLNPRRPSTCTACLASLPVVHQLLASGHSPSPCAVTPVHPSRYLQPSSDFVEHRYLPPRQLSARRRLPSLLSHSVKSPKEQSQNVAVSPGRLGHQQAAELWRFLCTRKGQTSHYFLPFCPNNKLKLLQVLSKNFPSDCAAAGRDTHQLPGPRTGSPLSVPKALNFH